MNLSAQMQLISLLKCIGLGSMVLCLGLVCAVLGAEHPSRLLLRYGVLLVLLAYLDAWLE